MSHPKHPPIFAVMALTLLVIFCGSLFARPSPIHRYSFSETGGTVVADSIGLADGVVKGSGASWVGGELILPGGNSATAAYVDLPNGMISGLTDVSIEAWTTNNGTQNWARIFDFGSTQGGEVTGPGGGGVGLDYLMLSASRGADNNQQRLELHNEDPGGGGFSQVDSNLASVDGVKYHHVVTYDADGAGAQGQIKYYRDAVLVAQVNTPTQLNEVNDVNNWLGRSNWTADENYNGSFDELRIYEAPLDQAEVSASNAAGPDALVVGPAIDSFVVAPLATFEGESATLSWAISGVSGALSVSIEPGIGTISGAGESGSVMVNPLLTTSYTLTVADGLGAATASAMLTVDPGVPLAEDQSLTTPEGEAKAVTLAASDPNGGSLIYSVVTAPAHGMLSGTPPLLTYTPNAGYVGSDEFTFKVNDGSHDSNTATVSMTVLASPQPPSDLTLTSSAILSSAVPGSFIAVMVPTDVNEDDLHAYALVSGAGDVDNALFGVSANHLIAQSSFAAEIGNSFNVRLRVTDDDGLFFEKSFVLNVLEGSSGVVINEVHYNPADPISREEFIELFNPGVGAVDLSAWYFDSGVSFTFPIGTIMGAGEYLVVAQDPATMVARYGVVALGPWTGKLDGDGETVELRDATGVAIDVVDYKVGFPWPIGSAGDGGSMELLNPLLDNDLGSSWRVSQAPGDLPAATLLPLAASNWKWRPGSTEASAPTSEWRQSSFVEDASWVASTQLPIGYGTVNGVSLNTVVSGMGGNYNCLFLRNSFQVLPGEMPSTLQLRSTSDDGMIVWVNGIEVERRRFTGEPLIGGLAANQGMEGIYETVTVSNAASFLVEGSNTIAVQLFNTATGSSDLGFDIEVMRPAAEQQAAVPTPGDVNSNFTDAVPPNIRQVKHTPQQPCGGQAVVVSAKVTDPEGIESVSVKYQLVAPGQFIPARTPRTVAQILADPEGDPPLNPVFEDPANWLELLMVDDGTDGDVLGNDGIYSITVPAQAHRTMVRYRIEVADRGGASVRVPYADDESLNFAYFVYDGVPDFVASTRSVHPSGAGHVWPKESLTSVPVYHWLIRPQDMASLQAYDGSQQFSNNGTAAELEARRAYEWEGAMVYDGVVYDHIHARLRGGNSRYGDFDGRFPRGKRHYKFKFNRGYYFAAKDELGRPYERPWKIFNVSRMFGTKGGNSWGLPEELGDRLYQTMGVPTQRAHWFHFRVIDGAAEAPDQYQGDFWGIQQAQERYDVRFLESRDMAKGNLYKLSDFFFDAESQRRYQSQDMVSDGSEFDNIRFNLHGSQSAEWLNQYVNYEKWYGYSAVGEAIRHYDIFPEPSGRHRLKNLVWYFEPVGGDPTRGVVWQLPYDYDASWGPSFNNGWDHANNGLYGQVNVSGQPYIDKPEMKIAHRNVLRSFRDLVWQEDQVGGLLDDRADFISELTWADQDRWRDAPAAAGTANDDSLGFKVQDMKNFAFNGWSGEFPVGAGGRGAFLDLIADGPDAGQLPQRPMITYTGVANFPTDGLQFESAAFSDPQGAGSFAAIEWRIGEIEDPTAPAWVATNDFILENDLILGSKQEAPFDGTWTVSGSALRVGHTYRARVRHQDATGRFSHWSEPLEFTTGLPLVLGELQTNLMISEIMYHPGALSVAEINAGFVESDFEFIELQNVSATLSLDLTDVRFTKGVDFDFVTGLITSLAPGELVLVVSSVEAFEMRYGVGLPVAGAWDSTQHLSNGGEQLKLSHGSGTAIHDFIYDDAFPWPAAADGGGVSLVLIDPASSPDHGLAGSWRGSFAAAGTPGVAEGAGPFSQWMADNGLSDPFDDPNASGLSNLLVFALGADLLAQPTTASPKVSSVTVAGQEYAAFQYRRRQSATDISFGAEMSTDLDRWTAVTVPFSVEDNADGSETITVRSITPIGGNAQQFFRLRVEVGLGVN